jgi:hypothetical protein
MSVVEEQAKELGVDAAGACGVLTFFVFLIDGGLYSVTALRET